MVVFVQHSDSSEAARVRSRVEVALHPRYWSLLHGIGTCLTVWGITLLLLGAARSKRVDTDGPTIESVTLLFLAWSVAVPVYWILDVIRERVERVLTRDQVGEGGHK